MIQSMTGFANITFAISIPHGTQTHITMSLKSLNSRYLEVMCKLPSAFHHLETEIIKRLQKELNRGNIFYTMTMSNQHLAQGRIEPSLGMAQEYIKALRTIQEVTGLPGELTISDLIRIPNIISSEQQELSPIISTTILDVTDKLIQKLIETRTAEGTELLKDLEKSAAHITAEIAKIEMISANLLEQRKQEIAQTILDLESEPLEFIALRKNTLLIELDKMDINEEIVRFKAHLTSLQESLHSSDADKGRRLNFIGQELNREVNTIAAKSTDTQVGAHAINIKVGLEKIREQVQNIV